MRSRIYTIIAGHFKSWYRSKSNIFWTIAFPLLLIVLFGAIFGSGSTKFDLYLQNQDLNGNLPTPLSQGYVNVLNQTGAFNLHMVAAEQPDPLTYVKNDAQLHNRGQRLLVVPLGFNATRPGLWIAPGNRKLSDRLVRSRHRQSTRPSIRSASRDRNQEYSLH